MRLAEADGWTLSDAAVALNSESDDALSDVWGVIEQLMLPSGR